MPDSVLYQFPKEEYFTFKLEAWKHMLCALSVMFPALFKKKRNVYLLYLQFNLSKYTSEESSTQKSVFLHGDKNTTT